MLNYKTDDTVWFGYSTNIREHCSMNSVFQQSEKSSPNKLTPNIETIQVWSRGNCPKFFNEFIVCQIH